MKSIFKYFFPALIVFLFFQGNLSAQISGIKTIPGDYPGFAEAITDLNNQGVGNGGVVFNVSAGFIDTAINLTLTATGISSNTIIFQKSGNGANPVIMAGIGTSIAFDGIFKLIGSDYVTIDGIDLQENPANSVLERTAEWGYALLKANEINGCWFNTIKNCNITLNKLTRSSTGIYSANHKLSSFTELSITNAFGSNSNNKFLNNTISNVIIGIWIAGYHDPIGPYRYYDQKNEIGAEKGKRNRIFNFGGAGLNSAYGIYAIYQNEIKIYNSNINSKGGTWHTLNLTGIYLGKGDNSTADIFGDTVTVADSSITNVDVAAIVCNTGALGTNNIINIYNNVIQECEFPLVPNGSFNLLKINTESLNLNVYNNKIINNTYGSASFTANGTVAYIDITGSNLTSSEVPWKIYNNIIANNLNSQSGVLQGAKVFGISTVADWHLVEVYNNSIENNTWVGDIKAISHQSNTGFNCYNNIIKNITIPESNLPGTFIAIENKTGNTNGFNGMYNNIIENITSEALTKLTGIYFSSSSLDERNVYENKITNLSSDGGRVVGLELGTGNTVNFYKNKIAGLYTKNNTVIGINAASSMTSVNVYNNFISQLYASTAVTDSAVSAVIVDNVSNFRAYYNTVYLDAVSTSSSKFGTSGIYIKNVFANLELRNNIIINASTPGPESGFTVAFRRDGTSMTSYSNSSNNNIFYAGVPSHKRLIFYNGTNSDSTLAQYKLRVIPRDNLSFSELSPFINITDSLYNLHLKTNVPTYCESGARPISTPFSITDDYDGNVRNTTRPDIGANEGNFTPIISSINDGEVEIPVDFSLYQNFPNPFNPATIIKYDIPSPSHVKLHVFDLMGRMTAELINGEIQAGKYQVEWNAAHLSSGIYFYSLYVDGVSLYTKKMILIK